MNDRDAHLASDRREPGDRARHRATLQRGGLARHHLLSPPVSRCLPVGRRRGEPYPDRPRQPQRRDREGRGHSRDAGRAARRAGEQRRYLAQGPGGQRLNTFDTDLRTWGHVFHVNFFASVVLARSLRDELAAAKGAVVNVTSIAGARVHPFAGAAYATSKAALAALTREMAHDFGPLGVRVNAIAPGEIRTDILSAGTEELADTIPMRRLGEPREVADTVYFLCTQPSAYISGTEIEINGAQHV